ncbi:hypothetical protein [Pseudomonas caspiana]|uniref:Uncharacterized protein n=1 Tax=Pseudomonas caspiana TaxID=1451454 RepID=A0A1Y3P1Q5_9PSED|nr:hypothetical protein [Pseudomonas caspiana]OUM72441.1 hypothetical protein AUC60_17860 [Pseudomonas caspiana]
MEVTVRVMSCGLEIDRITRPLRTEGGQPAVTYRKQLWPVKNGCIEIGTVDDAASLSQDAVWEDWTTLVTSLLPSPLPTQINACSDLLQIRFRGELPSGILSSISSLTCLGLEQEARALLVDFLRERKESERLYRFLLSHPIEGNEALDNNTDLAPNGDNLEQEIALGLVPENEGDDDWGWESADEIQTPKINDQHLREAAKRTQEALCSYRPIEEGARAPDLAGPLEDFDWIDDRLITQQPNAISRVENVLMERTAKLGETALDVLRYFVDNPGDRSAHAELVLGYAISDINKLLSGSLSHYLNRNSSGGWVCHSWVPNLLSALDEVS